MITTDQVQTPAERSLARARLELTAALNCVRENSILAPVADEVDRLRVENQHLRNRLKMAEDTAQVAREHFSALDRITERLDDALRVCCSAMSRHRLPEFESPILGASLAQGAYERFNLIDRS